jgi:hypothetical protein
MISRRPNFTNIESFEWGQNHYDLSVFALGFESRATGFVEKIAKRSDRSIAIGFDHGQTIAYEHNKFTFSENNVNISENVLDVDFSEALSKALSPLKKLKGISIFVDISCFSRFRLASIVKELQDLVNSHEGEITIDYGYSLAPFEDPPYNRRPNLVLGPAHPAFSGWSQGGYSSTAAVLGLGYEQDQALGVVEYLQAGEVWAFSPNSPIPEYKIAVSKANELLLSEIETGHVLEYGVCNPTSTIARLESVIRGLSGEHSIVLVPFGPKIFVLCALMVAVARKEIAVWRVSQGSHIEPCDRIVSDVQIGLKVHFTK